MKRIFIILLLIPIISFGQKTNIKIQGISVFKIGDTVDSVNTYGFNFTELFIDPDFNFSDKYADLDTGKNFCNLSRIFFCESLKIGEFDFSGGATLTYYNDHLIDISLSDLMTGSGKLQDALKQKYGTTYGKIFLKGYKYNLLKLRAKGVKITSAIDKQLQDDFLTSVYWNDGNNIISSGGSNSLYEYNFTEHHFVDPNLGRYGVSVTNFKEYLKLIQCSNIDYKKKMADYLKKLKDKSKVL